MNDLYESNKKDFIELLQENICLFVLNDDIKENFDIKVRWTDELLQQIQRL